MGLLVLDFETFDPYISRGLGSGWTYKLNVDKSDFRVLGFSYTWLDGVEIRYLPLTDLNSPGMGGSTQTKLQNLGLLQSLLNKADGVIFHNAPYDLGCLLTLGIDITNLVVYDTKIIGKLYDNRLFSYSLEDLSKKYLPQDKQKKKNSLIEIMEEHALGPLEKLKHHKTISYSNLLEKKKQTKTYLPAMNKWAYSNMPVLQEKDFTKFAYYAEQDVIATVELFKLFTKEEVPIEQAAYWSKITKICVDLRRKGIKVDMNVIKKAIPELENEIHLLSIELRKSIGMSLALACPIENLDSPKKLAFLLGKLGYELPKSDKGNDSTSSKWMEQQDDELLNKIIEYRTLKKLLNDFCIKVLEMQEYTCPEGRIGDYGRVFPEYAVLGAGTGRMSCSCPNMQNIPKRNKKWGNIIRSMFVPDDPKKTWYSLDWSNQEGRLQIHYGYLSKAEGASLLRQEFLNNPILDIHQIVANMANIDRKSAKTINLGLSYGMGLTKLAKSLGLDIKQAKLLLLKFYDALPYLKQLNESCKTVLTNRGFVYTLLKRKLKRERYQDDYGNDIFVDYKAMNKIMQGGGADLMYMTLIALYDLGIDIKSIIHDEFNIEGSLEDALKVKYIMETVYNLEVPLITEISEGPNWGTLIKIGDTNENNTI